MEIKPNSTAGLGPAENTGTAATRKARETADRHAAERNSAPSAADGDQVQLSAVGTVEIQRAQRIEALEKAVADGTYNPPAKKIAHGVVDAAIGDD